MQEPFGRSEPASVQKSIEIIEKVLREWHIDPSTVKDPNQNMWFLVQGSAKFHIQLFKFNKGPKIGTVDCVEIGATIMKLPDDNFLPLYRKLLDLNANSVGVYFAIRQNLVMLLGTREVEGMDFSEFKTLLDEVRFFADHWDDILIQEFGGKK